jgi:hypothetical protein
MESVITDNQEAPEKSPGTSKVYVYTIRDWKEYLGESALIIFSVLLALLLTEYFSSLHEKENTKTILKSIVAELNHNKITTQEMNNYNLQVLNKIDSALVNKDLQQQLVSNDEFHLKLIAPQGVLYRYFDDEAWTIAKNNNVMAKVDVETVSILTKVYEDQNRVMKVEDEVAHVILNRESRDPNKVHSTLILIRDIYHGWAVDRTELLLQRMDNAIKKVEAY